MASYNARRRLSLLLNGVAFLTFWEYFFTFAKRISKTPIMKSFKKLMVIAVAMMTAVSFTSCGDDDDDTDYSCFFRGNVGYHSQKCPIQAAYLAPDGENGTGINVVFLADSNVKIGAPQITTPTCDWFVLYLPTKLLGQHTTDISQLYLDGYYFQEANSINHPHAPLVYMGDIYEMEIDSKYEANKYFSIDMKAQLHNGDEFEVHYAGTPYFCTTRIERWILSAPDNE